LKATAIQNQRRQGYVKNVVLERGFAWVADEFGDSFYASLYQLLNCEGTDLKPGMGVTFTISTTPRGPAASNVVAII
jgi:cold shock CspA family protein